MSLSSVTSFVFPATSDNLFSVSLPLQGHGIAEFFDRSAPPPARRILSKAHGHMRWGCPRAGYGREPQRGFDPGRCLNRVGERADTDVNPSAERFSRISFRFKSTSSFLTAPSAMATIEKLYRAPRVSAPLQSPSHGRKESLGSPQHPRRPQHRNKL